MFYSIAVLLLKPGASPVAAPAAGAGIRALAARRSVPPLRAGPDSLEGTKGVPRNGGRKKQLV